MEPVFVHVDDALIVAEKPAGLLAVDWENRPRSKVDPVHGWPSRTRWRAMGYDTASDATRVELAPVTFASPPPF